MAFDAGTIEAKLDIDRSPFKRGLAEARKEAEAFEKRGVKLKLEIDRSQIDKIDSILGKARAGAKGGVKVPVEVSRGDIEQVKRQLEEIGDNTELTAKRSGNRIARGLLNPLVLSLGLIPGIAMAAAGGGALALAALPVAIGAIGYAALKSNEDIKSAYAGVWQDIKTEAESIAEPLVGTFEGIAHRIFGTWRQLRPELEQMFKDAGPLIDSFADGVLGLAEEAVPRFQQALAVSGPAMRGFESLLKSTGAGVGEMAIAISDSSSDVGRSTQLLGEFIRDVLQTVGQLVATLSDFWADVGPKFNRVWDKATDALVRFTTGGLTGAGQGLQIVLSAVEVLLNVLGPFADIFGQLGGYLLAAAAGWKLFAGGIGLVVKLWGMLSPAAMVGRLAKVSEAVGNVSTRFGEYVAIATNSATAGERAESGFRKVANGAIKAITWLPLIGTALGAAQAAIDHFWPSADTLAEKIQKGGAAAAEAHDQMYSVADGYNRGSLWAQTFAATSEEVRDAIEKQRASMTNLERAQADASKAQQDYDYAVEKFGPNSKEAAYAATNLAGATNDVEEAQWRASRATQDHTDKIIEQTNLMLGAVGARLNYQSALLQLEQAQRAATDAVKDHGVGSLEARDADIQYQQQLLQVINAIGARVQAENAGLGPTKAGELATAAMRQEIARLAVEAGTNLPPSLAEMAAKLSDAELAAMGVTRGVNDTGQAIYTLPPGKSLSFPTDAPVAISQIQGVQRAIDGVQSSKWISFYVQYITTNSPPKPSNPGDPANQGTIPFRAEGGPVKRNKAYWVGEKGVPELFFPNEDGFVLNGNDSARMTSGNSVGSRGGGSGSVASGGDGAFAPDYGAMVDAVAEAFQRVLAQVRLEIDGDQWAKVVNQTNLRNGAR